MTSKCETIFGRFLLKVTDPSISLMSDELATEMMHEWMNEFLSDTYVRKIFSSLSYNKEQDSISYEMRHPIEDSQDQDFVEELIAEGMVEKWVEPQRYSVMITKQVFGNSEEKFYSQAAHAEAMKDLYTEARGKVRKMIRDRGYIHNDYLESKKS